MLATLRRLVRDESGEDLIEYGLLAAFIATVAFGAIILDPLNLQPSMTRAYRKARSALMNA